MALTEERIAEMVEAAITRPMGLEAKLDESLGSFLVQGQEQVAAMGLVGTSHQAELLNSQERISGIVNRV